MMSLWRKIFNSPTAISETAKAVANGLDALVYTSEEKANDAHAAKAAAQMSLVRWLDASKGSRVARRLIAITVTTMWSITFTLQLLLGVLMPWFSTETSAKINASLIAIGNADSPIGGEMLIVLSFYFAAPHMSEIISIGLKKIKE